MEINIRYKDSKPQNASIYFFYASMIEAEENLMSDIDGPKINLKYAKRLKKDSLSTITIYSFDMDIYNKIKEIFKEHDKNYKESDLSPIFDLCNS